MQKIPRQVQPTGGPPSLSPQKASRERPAWLLDTYVTCKSSVAASLHIYVNLPPDKSHPTQKDTHRVGPYNTYLRARTDHEPAFKTVAHALNLRIEEQIPPRHTTHVCSSSSSSSSQTNMYYQYCFVQLSYTGALLPLLPEPATLSTSVDTTGKLSRFPSTGVARSA